jgi:hypothetical protein
MKALNQAEGLLGGALGRLFAVAESYPDLKANQNMLAFQEELTSTENINRLCTPDLVESKPAAREAPKVSVN